MGEYSRGQRNQLSRAVANNANYGIGSMQLKGFVDNRGISIVQMKVLSCNGGDDTHTPAKLIETKTLGTSWYQYNKSDIPNRFENNIYVGINKGADPVLHNKKVDIIQPNTTRLQDYYAAEDALGMSRDYRKGKYTWHHLADPYFMVLVDMGVHSAFGHKGGFAMWAESDNQDETDD